MVLTLPSSITGIIFNTNKVVFQNNPPSPGSDLIQNPLQNISQMFQGISSNSLVGIVIDATLTEQHSLTSEVTCYPIEGDPINNNSPNASPSNTVSDHVQLKPLIYSLTGVISDTPIGFMVLGNVANLVSDARAALGAIGIGTGTSRSIEAYNAIFNLWKSRTPFTVTTALKKYSNMIFTSFVVDKDPDSANEINFKATLQQVTIVNSQSIQGQNLSPTPRIRQTAQDSVNFGSTTVTPQLNAGLDRIPTPTFTDFATQIPN